MPRVDVTRVPSRAETVRHIAHVLDVATSFSSMYALGPEPKECSYTLKWPQLSGAWVLLAADVSGPSRIGGSKH